MADDRKNKEDYRIKICEGLEKLRAGNKDNTRISQLEALKSSNSTAADINKYLFAISLALIPVFFSLISSKDVRGLLSFQDRFLLVAAILSILVSAFFGIAHMGSELGFFKKWLLVETKKLKLWSSLSFWPSDPSPNKIEKYINEYGEALLRSNELTEKLQLQSPNYYLIGQVGTLIIGVIIIVLIVTSKIP